MENWAHCLRFWSSGARVDFDPHTPPPHLNGLGGDRHDTLALYVTISLRVVYKPRFSSRESRVFAVAHCRQ